MKAPGRKSWSVAFLEIKGYNKSGCDNSGEAAYFLLPLCLVCKKITAGSIVRVKHEKNTCSNRNN